MKHRGREYEACATKRWSDRLVDFIEDNAQFVTLLLFIGGVGGYALTRPTPVTIQPRSTPLPMLSPGWAIDGAKMDSLLKFDDFYIDPENISKNASDNNDCLSVEMPCLTFRKYTQLYGDHPTIRRSVWIHFVSDPK